MITITVKKKNGSYVEFLSKGHADYAREGRDIICSAVSTLIINTVNSLEAFTKEKFRAEDGDGFVRIRFEQTPNTPEGKLLMDSLVLGLTCIGRDYNNRYLTLRIREV